MLYVCPSQAATCDTRRGLKVNTPHCEPSRISRRFNSRSRIVSGVLRFVVIVQQVVNLWPCHKVCRKPNSQLRTHYLAGVRVAIIFRDPAQYLKNEGGGGWCWKMADLNSRGWRFLFFRDRRELAAQFDRIRAVRGLVQRCSSGSLCRAWPIGKSLFGGCWDDWRLITRGTKRGLCAINYFISVDGHELVNGIIRIERVVCVVVIGGWTGSWVVFFTG